MKNTFNLEKYVYFCNLSVMGNLQLKSLFFSLIVLFTLMYQSVHRWEHYGENRTENCHHHDHQEHSDNQEDCSVCDFNFITYDFDFNVNLIPKKLEIRNYKELYFSNIHFKTYNEKNIFNLRAPPVS